MTTPPILGLPSELVIRIFCELILADLAACQLTHSTFSDIRHQIKLQYRIATQIAAVEDNPDVKLGVDERLERLKAHEQAWDNLDFDFSQKIRLPADSRSHGMYHNGAYFFMDEDDRALH